MADLGYYTIPVLPSFRGITGEIQDGLNRELGDAGSVAGKIMGQSAMKAFQIEMAAGRAISTSSAEMGAVTDATKKQTEAVIRLDDAHKQLSKTRREQTQIITAEEKHTEALRKSETQIKRNTTQADELAKSIKKVNDEQKRTSEIVVKSNDSRGSDFDEALDKILNRKVEDFVADLGQRVRTKAAGVIDDTIHDVTGKHVDEIVGKITGIGGTIDSTVKDITGMHVDAIVDKVVSTIDTGAQKIGVDVVKVLNTAKDDGFRSALEEAQQGIATKAGSAAGNFLRDQVTGITGVDIGGMPGVQQLGQQASDWLNNGGTDTIVDWLTGGGIGDTVSGAKDVVQFVKSGGLGQALAAARRGDLSGLGSVDVGSALRGANDFTGGMAQPFVDLHDQIAGTHDEIRAITEGLLGGTAAEKYLPALSEAALPVVAGTIGGKYLADKFENSDLLNNRNRLESGYDNTGTAINRFERAIERIPILGDFLGPSQDIRNANKRRAEAAVGSTDSFYKSIFGDDQTGIGLGVGASGGGAVNTTAQQVAVQSSVATISAGSVVLGNGVSLPSAASSGTRAAAPSAIGSAGSTAPSEASLYGSDGGSMLLGRGRYAGGTGAAGVDGSGRLFGPGTPTSDSIIGVGADGIPTARVSVGEGVVKERAMRAGAAPIVAWWNRRYAGGTGPGGVGGLDTKGAQVDTIAVAEAVQKMFGVGNIGMYRSPDGFNEHSSGLAADVMVGGNKALGDRIAEWALGQAGRYDIQYVLWQQRQWNPNGSSTPMADRGSPTQNHMDHVHIRTAGGGYPQGGGPGGAGAGVFSGAMSSTPAPGVNQPFSMGAGGGPGQPPALGGGGGGNAMAAFGAGGGMSALGGIGQAFMQDTFGLGSLFPDPMQLPPVQFLLGLLGGAMGQDNPFSELFGGGQGTFGGLGNIFGELAANNGPQSGMIPGLAPGAAAGGLDPATASGLIPGMLGAPGSPASGAQTDQSTHVTNDNRITVNGHSSDDIVNKVYRAQMWPARGLTYTPQGR